MTENCQNKSWVDILNELNEKRKPKEASLKSPNEPEKS